MHGREPITRPNIEPQARLSAPSRRCRSRTHWMTSGAGAAQQQPLLRESSSTRAPLVFSHNLGRLRELAIGGSCRRWLAWFTASGGQLPGYSGHPPVRPRTGSFQSPPPLNRRISETAPSLKLRLRGQAAALQRVRSFPVDTSTHGHSRIPVVQSTGQRLRERQVSRYCGHGLPSLRSPFCPARQRPGSADTRCEPIDRLLGSSRAMSS